MELTAKEREAYERHKKLGMARIGPSKSFQLFQLFLAGKSCEEIVRLVRGPSLGAVVEVRLEDQWDEKRQEYVLDLMRNAREMVQMRQLESVVFLTDMMAAVHRLYGDRIRTFLQTGNPDDLNGLKLDLKLYKETLELMLKMTGQDKNKGPSEIIHKHQVEQTAQPQSNTGLRPEQAAEILRILDSNRKDD